MQEGDQSGIQPKACTALDQHRALFNASEKSSLFWLISFKYCIILRVLWVSECWNIWGIRANVFAKIRTWWLFAKCILGGVKECKEFHTKMNFNYFDKHTNYFTGAVASENMTLQITTVSILPDLPPSLLSLMTFSLSPNWMTGFWCMSLFFSCIVAITTCTSTSLLVNVHILAMCGAHILTCSAHVLNLVKFLSLLL